MKKKKISLLVAVSLLLLVACGSQPSQPIAPQKTKPKKEVTNLELSGAESFQRFAAASGSVVLQEEGNQVYGTVGPYQLLGLLSEGADGQSKEEIYQTLHMDTKNIPSLETFNRQLVAAYQDEKLSQIANSVWYDQRLTLKEPFEKTAKEVYLAETEAVPFAEQPQKASKKIAEWVEKKVGADLFDKESVGYSTRLVLVNTVRLNLAWLEKFEVDQTQERVFNEGQKEVKTAFMNQVQPNYQYARGDNYLASSLALENDHRLLFVLPDEGVSVNTLIETPEKLAALLKLEEKEVATVNFAIPKFKFSKDVDLSSVVKQLGVTSLFDPKKADLRRLTNSSDQLFVNEFKQSTQFELDEEKVKVESVTVAQVEATAAFIEEEVIELTLDRPFMFIVQGKDRLPLFMGVIRNPTIAE